MKTIRLLAVPLYLTVLVTAGTLKAQTAPSTYNAYTGTDIKTIPPAPVLGPANSVFKDPTFGSQILRVTDPNSNGGESFISTDSGFHRAWNADSTAIKLSGAHGDGWWLEFNPATFQVGGGSSNPKPHPVPASFGGNSATWEWSAVDPNVIYFLNGKYIASYNKATGVQTNLGSGTPSGDPVSYFAVVIGRDDWVCAAAGPGPQDTYTEIYCVNPSNPGTSEFIDVTHKTINGTLQSDPNWPTSAKGQTIGIHDISGGTGSRWLEVTFHGNSWGANGGAVLDLGTNTWSEITNADIYWSGHVSMGNGTYANSAGSIDGEDSRGIILRNPDNAMNASEYQFVSQPPEPPANKWCDGDHISWLNSMTNPNAPILVSRYYASEPCAFAWAGEIYAAAVDGSNTVWRFAHSHDGTDDDCYYGLGFAQISNDGNWVLFSSPWDGTLGADTAFGCQTRIDTFIIKLTIGAQVSSSAITTASLPAGTQGVAYSATLAATAVKTPYTWSIVSGSLPAGLTLGASSGIISGTPTTSGVSTFEVQVADANAQKATVTLSLTIAAAPQPPTITTASLPAGTKGWVYNDAALAATGGKTPYAWSIASGSLPAGLTLGANSGIISGMPTASGISKFNVQVADANAQKATAALSLTIAAAPQPPAITTASLPAGTRGRAYSATLAATNGTTPYTWSIASGSLPAGLTLGASSGIISGTPTASGASTFKVQVADANAQKATAQLTLTINSPAIQLVQSNAVEGSSIASISAAFSSANQKGNLIIAFIRMSTTTETVNLSDTAGNVYVEAVNQSQTADGHQILIFYARDAAGGGNKVTATFSNANAHPWLAIYEYSGLNATAPLDRTAHAQGVGATANSGPTALTSSSNELVFVGVGLPSSYTGSPKLGSGYSAGREDTGASRAAAEFMVVNAAGVYSGAVGLNPAANWSAVLATFKP